ncbi:MAG: hypothetical protein PHZ00_01845 [Candidatus Peribacteraceae bacterium]|nr:hypothetical protein [Candidatus Peribacteraceae bacterium]
MRSLRLSTIVAIITLSFAACGGKTVIKPDNTATGKIQEYNKVTGKDLETSPEHGTLAHLWYGALTGINDTPANGVGFLREFEDGVFTGSLNLNILPRKDGKRFIAWMAKPGGADPVRVGELTSIVGDSRHSLSFEVTEILSDRTVVLITLETTPEPASPGTRAAEGTLKEVERK